LKPSPLLPTFSQINWVKGWQQGVISIDAELNIRYPHKIAVFAQTMQGHAVLSEFIFFPRA
jgi:hypothetical protein